MENSKVRRGITMKRKRENKEKEEEKSKHKEHKQADPNTHRYTQTIIDTDSRKYTGTLQRKRRNLRR